MILPILVADVEKLVPVSQVYEESDMLENKPIYHFWFSRVHFQSRPVFNEADNVGMQKNAGLDKFFSRLIIRPSEKPPKGLG